MKNEKLRVTSAQIIVTGTKEKPYYEIKYREVGKEDYCIGYSSYCLDNVFEYLEECFDLVEDKNVEQRWIPVSERLPDDSDVRFYMCIVENHEEDLPMFCQYAEEYGFGFWRDYYDADTLGFVDSEFQTNEELGYEKVVAWMPLPEPYRESEVEDGE